MWPSVARAVEALSDDLCDSKGLGSCPLRSTIFVGDSDQSAA